MRHAGRLLVFTLVAVLPVVASAQTGPALVLQPWDEPTSMQIGGNLHLFGSSDIDGTNDDLRLTRFALDGRFRLDAAAPQDETRIGFDMVHWELDTDDNALPERLNDTSVGGAWVRELDQGRRVALVAGVGQADDDFLGDNDAIYFQADAIFQQPLDRQSMLTLTLNYDGNRSIWPDVPLPLVAYTRRVNDEWSYTLGLPRSSVRWQPNERWVLSAAYLPTLNISARAEYFFDDAWRLFGEFDNDYHGFAIDGDRDRRLFLRQRRLEGGIEYRPHHQWHATIAAGLAFDQRFERGWDTRDTTTVRDIDSAPYIRAALGFEF